MTDTLDPKRIAKALTDARDIEALDPDERGLIVLNFLFHAIGGDETGEPELIFRGATYWDLLCFANCFLGMAAVGSQEPTFIEIAKATNRWVYNAHYSLSPGDALLGESREARQAYWAGKTEALQGKQSNRQGEEEE